MFGRHSLKGFRSYGSLKFGVCVPQNFQPSIAARLYASNEKKFWRCKMVPQHKLKYGPMHNVMAALPNIGGAVCSTPQNLADAQILECRAVTLPRLETR